MVPKRYLSFCSMVMVSTIEMGRMAKTFISFGQFPNYLDADGQFVGTVVSGET